MGELLVLGFVFVALLFLYTRKERALRSGKSAERSSVDGDHRPTGDQDG